MVDIQLKCLLFIARQRSYGKVMFSQGSVILFTGGVRALPPRTIPSQPYPRTIPPGPGTMGKRCVWLVVGLVGGVVDWLWTADKFQKEIFKLQTNKPTKSDVSPQNVGEHSCFSFYSSILKQREATCLFGRASLGLVCCLVVAGELPPPPPTRPVPPTSLQQQHSNTVLLHHPH